MAQWIACLRVVEEVAGSDRAETDKSRVSFCLFFSPKLPRNYMENKDQWRPRWGVELVAQRGRGTLQVTKNECHRFKAVYPIWARLNKSLS